MRYVGLSERRELGGNLKWTGYLIMAVGLAMMAVERWAPPFVPNDTARTASVEVADR